MKTVIIILTLLVVGCSKSGDQAKSSPVAPACLNSKFIQDTTTATEHTVFNLNCVYKYDSNSPVCAQTGTYTDTGIGSTSGKVHIFIATDTCASNSAGKTESCDYTLDSFGKPLVFNCVVN